MMSEYTDENFVPEKNRYAETLSEFIKCKTISDERFFDKTEFDKFLSFIKGRFPLVFEKGEYKDFNGGIMIKIDGKSHDEPLVLMSHYDVVQENGKWSFDAWSGKVENGIVYGRGAVDTKGSLAAIFESVESLLNEGFAFSNDLYIISSSREEIAGTDVPDMVKYLVDNGVKPKLVIDEGGGIVDPPVPGVSGKCAMIGMIERSSARVVVEFTNKDGKNAAANMARFIEKTQKKVFGRRDFGPVNTAMFNAMKPKMNGAMKFVFSNLCVFKPLLIKLLPKVNKSAASLLGATVAFVTPSDKENLDLPSNAIRIVARISGNYYNKIDDLVDEFTAFAKEFGAETKVVSKRETPAPEPLDSDGFKFVKGVTECVFPGVTVAPFCVLGGTDARHFIGKSQSVIRFAPIYMNNQQFSSFHNKDENISVDSVADAVRFYREAIKRFNK